jgi:hypothetical protein
MTGQSIYERIRFTDPQLTRLENNVEMTVEKLSHQFIGLLIDIVNPAVSDHPRLIAWKNIPTNGVKEKLVETG